MRCHGTNATPNMQTFIPVSRALYKVPFSSVLADIGGIDMITGELKSQVDAVWDAFWTGGISNPLEVMEQITYLLFIRRLDDEQTLPFNRPTTLSEGPP